METLTTQTPTETQFNSLKEQYQLQEKVVKKMVTDKHVDTISRSFCRRWDLLPTYLEMDRDVASDIKKQHREMEEEDKKRAFFFKWIEEKGSRATYKKLIIALLEINRVNDAEKVCKLLQPTPQLPQQLTLESSPDPQYVVCQDPSTWIQDHSHSIQSLQIIETLYGQEEVETKYAELQMEFSNIQEGIMDVLEENGIKLKRFGRALSTYPAAAHVQVNSFEHMKTVSGRGVKFDDIFQIWNQEVVWSFLDYALLEVIVWRFGSNELKDTMKEYSCKIKDFRRRTIVSRLMYIWKDAMSMPKELERYETLIHNLKIKAHNCTLEKLEVLRIRSCDKLLRGTPLSRAALVLYHIEYGCISVTWIVQTHLVRKMREALVQCIINGDYLKENDIVSLELDGELFTTMERSLILASAEGDVKQVNNILDRWNHKNHDVNETNAEGKTALILSSVQGHESVVCSLLEMGAPKININYQMEDTQKSALFFAYEKGHDGVVKLLLEYGADTQLKDKDKKVAADYGVVKKPPGRAKKVKEFVVEKGISFMKKSSSILKKKLLYLAEIGDYDGIKKLLEEGNMDVDVRDPSRKDWTSIMWACDEGHYEIVELLLQHWASVHLSSTTGWTPLHIACSNNFVRIAYLLLRSGADPDKVMKLNYTPLMYISDMDNMEPMARALLKHGANLEIAATENGWTPLIEACHSGKEELVKLYLDHGAKVNRKAKEGWEAVMAAARKDRGDIVRLLLEKEKTVVDSKNKKGESAIHIASFMGSTSVIPVLIEFGAKVNMTNEADLSPLMIATNCKNIGIVEALCQSEDIDVDLQQKRTGLTALFLAAKNGHVEIFKKLLQYGASDEIDMNGQKVNIHDVVRVFKKRKRDILKALERHKLEVEQRKQLEEVEGEQEISNVQRVQEKSEVDQTEILAGEKSIIEDLVVPEEEMVEPLTTDLGPPVVAAEEDTSEPLLLSVVKKESVTEEELVASAPSEAVGDAALEETGQPIAETSIQDESIAVGPDEPTQPQNEEASLVGSADDSSSDTSSLYEAEVVCGISQKQGKTHGGESSGSKTLAETQKVINSFGTHVDLWNQYNQHLRETEPLYSSKGLKPIMERISSAEQTES